MLFRSTPLNGDVPESARLRSAADGVQGRWSDPEQALNRRQMLEALDCCVHQLPARTAQTFLLRQVMGHDTAEACQMLELSESNCAVMLHRARNWVRESFDPDWITR